MTMTEPNAVTLTDEQQAAVDTLVSLRKDQATLGGLAGTGKSTIIRSLVKRLPDFAVCAYTGKAAQVLRKKGVEASTIHSLIYRLAMDDCGEPESPVRFELTPAGEFAPEGIIVDECFPAGTLVDTPTGRVAIEKLNVGDEIINLVGVDRIVATKRNEVHRVISISFGNEESCYVSQNHPFLTGRGWVRAEDLESGDSILSTKSAVRMVQAGFLTRWGKWIRPVLQQALSIEVPRGRPKLQRSSRTEAQSMAYLWQSEGSTGDRTHKTTQPDEQQGHRGEDDRGEDRQRYVEAGSRREQGREWDGAYRTTKEVVRGAGTRLDSRTSYTVGRQVSRIPDELQSGPWQPDDAVGNRVGRTYSQQSGAEGEGQEERHHAGFVRVDRVEVYEQDDHRLDGFRDADGKLRFYDIQAARSPSFSVAGLVVHNSSMVGSEIHRDLVSLGVPLIFVGDHGQLEPVGSGGFNLMTAPDITLETIHRNAGEIARFANHLRQGHDAKDWAYAKTQWMLDEQAAARSADHGDGQVEVVEAIDGVDIAAIDQMICAFNYTRVAVNRTVREELGFDADKPVVGDRIMCLQNDCRAMVFNGMQGELVAINGHSLTFTNGLDRFTVRHTLAGFNSQKKIDYQRGVVPFDYAYCVTCHKAQGDEWDHVLVLEQKCGKWDMKRWNYTAASRARKKLTWVLAS